MMAKWSASRPHRLAAGDKVTGNQRIGGWVGPRAGLNALVKTGGE